jgi:DNA modification methylase
MRPELAGWAIEKVTTPGQRILDPFCGSGTVLLEGWSRNRQVVGTDLSPYAWLISTAKLLLSGTDNISSADIRLEKYHAEVNAHMSEVKLETIDPWIQSFYHPRTLRELITWSWTLRRNQDPLFLASLMAIAHHQRPGFLSYPASHTVPYLRTTKFPKEQHPELYEYRAVQPRLEKKIKRALKDAQNLNQNISRTVYLGSADKLPPQIGLFDAIITSPPYMGQLHYARDNRLRLALLGRSDWRDIDKSVSPNYAQFSVLIKDCFKAWTPLLRVGGKIAILIGDTTNTVRQRLDTFVIETVDKACKDLKLDSVDESAIPDARRARKNCSGSSAELLLVFQKKY